ncbi:MAG TPA: hypothetical protein VLG47_06910 [Candidatus Saccharimonadales bacterium]|nr:hypothetical protein [Candidatus Saccharimonadales bacterium]
MFGHPESNGPSGGQSAVNATHSDNSAVSRTNASSGSSGAPAVNDDLLGDFVMDAPKKPTESSINPTKPASSGTSVAQDELLSIKQQALQQLSPLVDHLDQTPEEKFRTTMMLIQAADNQSLLKDAYAAAQKITDEKVRAQALLDVVNEINYFTQHTDDRPEAA